MEQIKNNGNGNNALRTIKVIYETSLRGPSAISTEDVFTQPLYKVVKTGVLKLDPGVKRSPSDIFVFVVDGAPEWFMEKYEHLIREMQVIKIIGEVGITPVDYPGKITTLLSLCGVYPTLDGTMIEALGRDFVSLKNTEAGTLIEPTDLNGQVEGDIYLRIDTEILSEDLLGIISGDLVELTEKENGLYSVMGSSPTEGKSFN